MANVTKYRVKQIGNEYYPQKRLLLFWRKIRVCTCSYNKYRNDITSYSDEKTSLCFASLDFANKQIANYINNYLRPFWCLGHRIKSYFCTDNNTYYYIDTASYRVFSDNSEQLCEGIAYLKEQEKNKREKEKQKKRESKRVTIHEYVED